MIFNFKDKNPKGMLKEFGSLMWVKNNIIQLAVQTALIMAVALYTGVSFLFIWALLPLLALLTFMIGDAARFGAVLQSFWYLPVLFWYAETKKFNRGMELMNSDMPNMGFGDKAAKVRSLGIELTFAPVDFLGCVASGYTDEQLEVVIADIESRDDDGSLNYKSNIAEISKYRAKKLSKE